MNLLIVDDEKLTREGIRDSLNLESLGISQVLLEDDGIHGLKTALEEKPDIVLTDVRMPRMNGVQMAERILKELPATTIIFMSAYSDKEYLKAAKRREVFETGDDYLKGICDKVLTLILCSYEWSGARNIVLAVPVSGAVWSQKCS